MATGYQLTTLTINNQAGLVVSNLAAALRAATDFNATLNDADRFGGAAGLVANWQFLQADANLLIAAFTDLDAYAQVGHGQREQVGLNNFFFNAKRLMGTNPL